MAAALFHRHQPDIPELHGITVILQHDRTRFAGVAPQTSRGIVAGDFNVIVDFDTIVIHSHASRFGLLAVLAFGRMELDVVALPDRRRFAGVHQRSGYAVNSATVILLAF